MSASVDLLLKAAGYLEFCIRDVLVHIPADIKYVNIFLVPFCPAFNWLIAKILTI